VNKFTTEVPHGEQITIRSPDDFHVHLREGALLKNVAHYTAEPFSRALVMPNTKRPIETAKDVIRYRSQIRSATKAHSFEPLMTFRISTQQSLREIEALKTSGALAGKLYPTGVTTNSHDGVRTPRQIESVLSAMEEYDLVLCIHAEEPYSCCLESETLYLKHLEWLLEKFPRLRFVVEHISSMEAIRFVLDAPRNVAATITVHHLLLTFNDCVNERMYPHFFCKPVPKRTADRDALIEAATSGNPKFFFGSDSAPHKKSEKENSRCAAGIFSAPVALPYLAQVFEVAAALHRLEAFVSEHGATFYRLTLNDSILLLQKRPTIVPEVLDGIVPFGAGTTVDWSISMEKPDGPLI
jgi:dihydroorotase